MKKTILILFLLISYLLLESCSNVEADHSQSGIVNVMSEQTELLKLNNELSSLNAQFGIEGTKTRADEWNWPRFWAITGSDAVGAVIFGLRFGWLGALGGGVASSMSSYVNGKMLDYNTGSGHTPSQTTGNNQNNIYETTSFVGYDEYGHELSYNIADLQEMEDIPCLEDEISEHLGTFHNEIIITLCQQYGDSLTTFSNGTIVDLALGLVGSWYGLDRSEIPSFDIDDSLFESCTLENVEDFESLTEDYPEYANYFPIIESYIVTVSQLETTEQILSYKAQANSLIQNSNLSTFTKATLQSGLDVMICSNGLWIYDDELVEEDD